jgi:hypothetical protein
MHHGASLLAMDTLTDTKAMDTLTDTMAVDALMDTTAVDVRFGRQDRIWKNVGELFDFLKSFI